VSVLRAYDILPTTNSQKVESGPDFEQNEFDRKLMETEEGSKILVQGCGFLLFERKLSLDSNILLL
jgi:hypothetical protein